MAEAVVAEHEVVGESGLRPEADVAPCLQRDAGREGELAILDDGVRRLHQHAAAGVEIATQHGGAGSDMRQRGDGIADLERQVLLQDDVVDQVRLRGRAPVLPERGDLGLQLRRVTLGQLRDLAASE